MCRSWQCTTSNVSFSVSSTSGERWELLFIYQFIIYDLLEMGSPQNFVALVILRDKTQLNWSFKIYSLVLFCLCGYAFFSWNTTCYFMQVHIPIHLYMQTYFYTKKAYCSTYTGILLLFYVRKTFLICSIFWWGKLCRRSETIHFCCSILMTVVPTITHMHCQCFRHFVLFTCHRGYSSDTRLHYNFTLFT